MDPRPHDEPTEPSEEQETPAETEVARRGGIPPVPVERAVNTPPERRDRG